MFIKLLDLPIYYKVNGKEGGSPVILLHGWGVSSDCFSKMAEYLGIRFTVYRLDLPGFGLSGTPQEVWSSTHYANLIKLFIEKLKLGCTILLGHSFGGKVVVNLVAQDIVPIDKIVLIGSAGIILPKSFKTRTKIFFFKSLKFLASLPVINRFFAQKLDLYRKNFGSKDYQKAKGIMRSILVKSVNESVVSLLPKIKVPTLLLWGEKDFETPLLAGKIFHKLIKNSQLKVILAASHYPFVDSWSTVKQELDSFLS